MGTLKGENHDLQSKLAAAEIAFGALNTKLSDKNKELTASVGESKNALKERDQAVRQRDQAVQARDEQVLALHEQVRLQEQYQAQVETLSAEVARLRRVIEELVADYFRNDRLTNTCTGFVQRVQHTLGGEPRSADEESTYQDQTDDSASTYRS